MSSCREGRRRWRTFPVVEECGRIPAVGAVPEPRLDHPSVDAPLLVLLPAVSWPWGPAWGSSEPPRQDGENAQKTRKNGAKMGEIRSKRCEGRELTKDQLAAAGAVQARAWAPRAGRIGSDGYRRAVPTRGESDGGFRLPAVVCRRTNNELFAVRALACTAWLTGTTACACRSRASGSVYTGRRSPRRSALIIPL